MNPKRISQRDRAITVYFATAEDKAKFSKAAEGFGFTASTLGGLMIYKAIEDGFFDRMRKAVSADGPSTIKRADVKSSKRPRTRRAKKAS